MSWIWFTIVMAIVAVAAHVGGRRYVAAQRQRAEVIRASYEQRGRSVPPPVSATWWVRWAAPAVGVVWLLATVFGFMLSPVASGEVGIVRQFGVIVGQRPSGVQFVLPWQTLETENIKTQHYTFSNQGDRKDQLTAASQDTQDVFMDATLNYGLSESAVQNLLKTVGTNWFETLVFPRVQNDVKEQTVKYEATAVLSNREKIRADTKAQLQSELQPYSINVSDFLINNVDFNPDFKAAVEAKQAAVQNAVRAQNDATAAVNKAEGDKQAAIKAAEGEAAAIKAKADAQAAANQEIAASVTPQLVAYQEALAHTQWRPTVISNGGGTIVDATPPTTNK
jgi:regulator of protease activity HflC (stomatin/prohibitin superfamily)